MEPEANLNSLFYGVEAAEKIDKFKEELLLIEIRNKEYFDGKGSKFKKVDRLHNHYIITTNPNGITFNFLQESDLPEDIKLSCHKLFKDIFISKD